MALYFLHLNINLCLYFYDYETGFLIASILAYFQSKMFKNISNSLYLDPKDMQSGFVTFTIFIFYRAEALHDMAEDLSWSY